MRSGLATFLAVFVVVVAGCGIPLDENPRAVPVDQRPTTTTQAEEPAQAGGTSSPRVFFLTGQTPQGGDRLQAARRDVSSSPEAVIGALLRGLTPEEQEQRLQTFVPAGTRLIETSVLADGTLQVDVSDAFFEAKGESQIKAVAQLVYTATGLSQVRQVRLLVDGQARDWPRGDGVVVSSPLTPFDYPELNPSSQPDYPPSLSPASPTTITTTP